LFFFFLNFFINFFVFYVAIDLCDIRRVFVLFHVLLSIFFFIEATQWFCINIYLLIGKHTNGVLKRKRSRRTGFQKNRDGLSKSLWQFWDAYTWKKSRFGYIFVVHSCKFYIIFFSHNLPNNIQLKYLCAL